jgi:hypothetical protein
MHLKKPSFRQTDSSSSWTHKSDSLPNFGVNKSDLDPHIIIELEDGLKSWFLVEDHVWFKDRWMVASLCDD